MENPQIDTSPFPASTFCSNSVKTSPLTIGELNPKRPRKKGEDQIHEKEDTIESYCSCSLCRDNDSNSPLCRFKYRVIDCESEMCWNSDNYLKNGAHSSIHSSTNQGACNISTNQNAYNFKNNNKRIILKNSTQNILNCNFSKENLNYKHSSKNLIDNKICKHKNIDDEKCKHKSIDDGRCVQRNIDDGISIDKNMNKESCIRKKKRNKKLNSPNKLIIIWLVLKNYIMYLNRFINLKLVTHSSQFFTKLKYIFLALTNLRKFSSNFTKKCSKRELYKKTHCKCKYEDLSSVVRWLAVIFLFYYSSVVQSSAIATQCLQKATIKHIFSEYFLYFYLFAIYSKLLS